MNLDLNLGLSIGCSTEYLRFLCWDCGISVDKLGEDSSKSLNTEGERGNIKEKYISNISS